MAFFKQYILPFFVILVFLVALVAVSARIFLPSDMVAPAPVAMIEPLESEAATRVPAQSMPAQSMADLPLPLKVLIQGLPATSISAPL